MKLRDSASVFGARMGARFGVGLGLALALAGCQYISVPDPSVSEHDAQLLALAPKAELDLTYARYQIDDPTGEAPGTVIIDTRDNFLYYVLPAKKAIRYGVATGREAYGWTGEAVIQNKAEWPSWNPPAEMMVRWPHLAWIGKQGGLPGGPDNPLGARAMYLFHDGKDTLYRIHGTDEPQKIGQSVSSGCIRMRNIDAIDLYNRVKFGTRVVVK